MRRVKRRGTYTGTTNLRAKKLDPEVRRALRSYYDQRSRCYNPNNVGFQFTGAKGLTVDYSAREFVFWWLQQLTTRASWTKPTCGRLDHDRGYNFDNIELQESAENTRERNYRWEGARPDIEMTFHGLKLRFRTAGEASRISGLSKSLLLDILNGKIEQLNDQPTWRLVPQRR